MFRLYDTNNLNNSPQNSPIISNVPMHFTMGRGLMRPNTPSVSPSVSPLLLSNSPAVSPMLLSNSPSLLFFQTPMIPNVSQAKGGCGSCGGTR